MTFMYQNDGKRQKKAAVRARAVASLLIEGEYLTSPQVAERLGVSPSVARHRINVAKAMDGPITWEKLRGTSK